MVDCVTRGQQSAVLAQSLVLSSTVYSGLFLIYCCLSLIHVRVHHVQILSRRTSKVHSRRRQPGARGRHSALSECSRRRRSC